MSEEVPFAFEIFPGDRMKWAEAPLAIENLLRQQAAANAMEIVRDKEVELRCKMPDRSELCFVVFWPSGEERMNMLVPADDNPSERSARVRGCR